jgi:hypothetical protein
MVMICECGSHDIRITDSWEQTDSDGFVIQFTEHYECNCGKNGRLEHRHGKDHLYGCLEHGGWF